MDYMALAEQMLREVQVLNMAKPQKSITESMHGEAFVLGYIAQRSGYVLPSEISHAMNVSTARIAAALNGLEKKGYIARQIDKSDRRKILVELTGEGKEAAGRYRQTILEIMASMLKMLGEHDAKEYVRITGRLAEILPGCIFPL